MPLLPGDQMLENYTQALTAGTGTAARRRRSGTMLMNSLVMALGDRDRQDRDLDPLGLRDRLLPLSAAQTSSSG